MDIVLVDDQVMTRAGLRCLIERIEGHRVVGEVAIATDAIHIIREVGPDAILLDFPADTERGMALLADISRLCPASRIIILGSDSGPEVIAEVLRQGVAAYLLTASNPAELAIALDAVARNECYLTPVVAKSLITRCLDREPPKDSTPDLLTARQQQILSMIAHRKTTKEIAYELDLSEKTIAAHRAQIMDRVGVRDIVGLVLWAVKNNLVERPA